MTYNLQPTSKACAFTVSSLDGEPSYPEQRLIMHSVDIRSTMVSAYCVVSFLLLLVSCNFKLNVALTEKERQKEYYARNYTWPLPYYVPNTRGWQLLNEHRFRQAAEINDRAQRFEAYLSTMHMAFLAPNFTEYGFGLVRAPDNLMEALRRGIRDGLAEGPITEKSVTIIDSPLPSWLIHRPDLTKRVLDELHYYPETWANTELTPHAAYGFRLYRENATLRMHIDRPQTHVISLILHIGSSEDAEPWPIMIEDFYGVTHEVVLTSGDMLLYESSKCLHGRPHPFKGSWYSSVFVHYYPKYGWQEVDHMEERRYALPLHWGDEPTTQYEIPLEMVGTGMKEPMCPFEWCQTKSSKTWGGPGKEGILMTPGGEEILFEPKPLECKDTTERCANGTS